MRLFVKTEAFRRLNVGFALDEGIATPDEVFSVFYAERSVWRVDFVCHGTTGHGSLLLENTAGEKLRHILDRMMNFRAEQQKILKNNPEFSIGDVTTVNLTIINGGVQSNVVPPSLTALFDVRIAVDVDHDAFEEMVISESHAFFNNNSMTYCVLACHFYQQIFRCFSYSWKLGAKKLAEILTYILPQNDQKCHQLRLIMATPFGWHSVKHWLTICK